MKQTIPTPLQILAGIGIIVLVVLAAQHTGLFATTSSNLGIIHVDESYSDATGICKLSGTASCYIEDTGWYTIGACGVVSSTYVCYAFSDQFYVATGDSNQKTINLKEMTIVGTRLPPFDSKIDVTLLKSPYQSSDIIGTQKVLTIEGCGVPECTGSQKRCYPISLTQYRVDICVDGEYEVHELCDVGASCSGGACIAAQSVPCVGLSSCTSDLYGFHECCDGDVWSCSWNNYDGNGYRAQWQLLDECDAGCTCDDAEADQECWCADLSPPCTGMSLCAHETYLDEACCNGDVWECQGHYEWTLKENCAADETCECDGAECPDCDCVASATPTPTPPATDCTPSDTYPRTCPNGTEVTWCTCTASGTWDCAAMDDLCAATEDGWQTYTIFGGIVVFLSLLYVAFRKKGGKP